ncbi:hypothetical protein AQPE_1496 [Aquipluma nitroreducens]|uniref:Uncharacterized protein n=1 Tax=Aquipluma nitroreducens TaxID=2010828 RepID=A0A5K7S731_9BACT|nr:hypothetical protein AQPE_1496 [Aquipluma nitroreducens]
MAIIAAANIYSSSFFVFQDFQGRYDFSGQKTTFSALPLYCTFP